MVCARRLRTCFSEFVSSPKYFFVRQFQPQTHFPTIARHRLRAQSAPRPGDTEAHLHRSLKSRYLFLICHLRFAIRHLPFRSLPLTTLGNLATFPSPCLQVPCIQPLTHASKIAIQDCQLATFHPFGNLQSRGQSKNAAKLAMWPSPPLRHSSNEKKLGSQRRIAILPTKARVCQPLGQPVCQPLGHRANFIHTAMRASTPCGCTNSSRAKCPIAPEQRGTQSPAKPRTRADFSLRSLTRSSSLPSASALPASSASSSSPAAPPAPRPDTATHPDQPP